MIAFACSHCGMKFQVKDEFAGRTTGCPTCKKPMVVPAPDMTRASLLPAQTGAMASLIQAGMAAGGVTLTVKHAAELAGEDQPRLAVADILAQITNNGQRYVVESEIARGGMGAVLRAIDTD